jgi:hypothetical protein
MVKVATSLGASTFDGFRDNRINPAMAETRKAKLDTGESSCPTLASKLLNIGRLRTLNDKSNSWFENLSCLWMNAGGSNGLQIKQGTPDGYNDADYIAVSYSWTPSPRLECDPNGKYAVTGARGEHLHRSVVRDEVLERVLRYANNIGIRGLWIDKECNPQEDLV